MKWSEITNPKSTHTYQSISSCSCSPELGVMLEVLMVLHLFLEVGFSWLRLLGLLVVEEVVVLLFRHGWW